MKETDLLPYFNGTAFTHLSDRRITQLFLDGLNATFRLDVRSTSFGESSAVPEPEAAPLRQRTHRRMHESAPFDRYYSAGDSRVGFWVSSGDDDAPPLDDSQGSAAHSDARIFRLKLSDYWIGWQRAARAAKFDFDCLETITDARALRFYELTKLWRAAPGQSAASPKKTVIAYGVFAQLFPLPVLRSEQQINEQIERIFEPLKDGTYIRSFAFRSDPAGASERNPQIVFRLDD